MRKVVVALPAYNEEASVASLIEQIFAELEGQPFAFHVIVCNDGSTDRTAEILADIRTRRPIEVLVHVVNRGLGETIRDLLERAVEVADGDDDVIVRFDCDDTHHPRYIPAMVAKLDEGHDVIIASRFQPGGGQFGVNGFRSAISLGANLFMKVFFPIRGVREYSCAYRAYRAPLVRYALSVYGNRLIQLKELGFTCTLEKLVKLNLLGARFAEVPFLLRYDQKLSISKMVSSITMLGYMVMTVMYYWPVRGWRAAAVRERHRYAGIGRPSR